MNHLRCLVLISRVLFVFVLAALFPGASRVELVTAAPEATYTVTNTNNGGLGSLRQAIMNVNSHVGPDLIDFAIPPGDPGCSGYCTIAPTEPLPALTDGGTTINGYTQPGALPATSTNPAVLYIELKGTAAGFANGLTINSADNVITGLGIDSFAGDGIYIQGVAATGNIIQGNHIGTSPGGTLPWGNLLDGVFIGSGASQNTVGGNEPAERNVLSGNGWNGVDVYDSGTDGNTVSGNYIGTQADGISKMENVFYGVRIYGGAKNNRVGGDITSESNLISGNAQDGVRIIGVGTDGNIVSGNYIGVDKTGSESLGNNVGILISSGAQYNTIGGDAPGESNLISGNLVAGVHITGTNTMSNTVSYNRIGTDANGVSALGNGAYGVLINGAASNNLVGGVSANERNLISSNWIGVSIEGGGTTGNVVSGNYIGTAASGLISLGNIAGVRISGEAQQNRIGGANASPGGACTGECNLISGNVDDGIILVVEGNAFNSISGNVIGLDVEGAHVLGNGLAGIYLEDSLETTIGGKLESESNLISGNGGSGVVIYSSTGISLLNNFIGVNAPATEALGNGSHGILINGDSEGVHVGTHDGWYGNLISGNQGDGVRIDSDSDTNHVWGNQIGCGASENIDLGNTGNGVTITGGAGNNEISTGNIILYNAIGVMITGGGVMENVVSSNRIMHSDYHGVLISTGARYNRIGPDNRIQDNFAYGVWITESDSYGNVVTRNSISSNSQGIKLDGGANNNMLAPEAISITMVGPFHQLTGTAFPNSLVEVFGNRNNSGEGEAFLGSTDTNGAGDFWWETDWITFPFITATATDPADGSSEFSASFANPYQFVYLPMVGRP